ncbi:putative inner membrane proton/cation antiporter [Salmonella enterica subsp. enterica serovar Paratyphi A]|nr:putative inner membrane proton/cation antiporter [Salmonella enterica subsp. enterica serovar Paratyphi A]
MPGLYRGLPLYAGGREQRDKNDRKGAGSEVMSRIATPMIGGMITAPLLSLFIIPAAYKLMRLGRHRRLAANVCRPPAASNCRRVQPTFIVRAR